MSIGNVTRNNDTKLAPWLMAAGSPNAELPATADAWAELARVAGADGLAGLVLEQASRRGIELPLAVLEQLRSASMVVAAGNIQAAAGLGEILKSFNRAGVPLMLLKGAALNLTVYPRPDLRPTSDVDLLIHPDHVEASLRLLEECGCRRGFDLVRDDFFPKYHYEVELFTDSPAPVRIDLHARPLRPLRISQTMPDDGLWEGAQSVLVGDAEAKIPSPEMMFIHLAAHAAYHGCSRLLWLYDIKRLTDAYGDSMDWGLIVRRTGQWRLSWPLLRAIERAGGLLGPVCPSEVTHALGAHPTSWRDRLALAHAPRDASSPMSHLVVDLLCTPGFRFRLGYLLSFLLPGKKHLAGLYPYRHRGWQACAHVWRGCRAVLRGLEGLLGGLAAASRLTGRRAVRSDAHTGAGR